MDDCDGRHGKLWNKLRHQGRGCGRRAGSQLTGGCDLSDGAWGWGDSAQPLNGNKQVCGPFRQKADATSERFLVVNDVQREKQAFVANPINRYAIGDRDKLKFNQDGSLDIYLQHDSPGKDKESNWLPADAGEFNVIMRIYWPKETVLNGTWTPPAIKKVELR